MSRDQNAGRSYSMKIDNSPFVRVKEFKYLEITLTHQNFIQEEIKSRLKSRNACYYLVRNLLYQVWGRKRVYTEFWWGNLRERDYLEDPCVDGRVILRWISTGERPAAARLLRPWVRVAPGAWIFVCCECRVLSGRGLCDELINRPEESYRLCCVVVCNLETSKMGAPYIYIYDISRLRVNFIWHAVRERAPKQYTAKQR